MNQSVPTASRRLSVPSRSAFVVREVVPSVPRAVASTEASRRAPPINKFLTALLRSFSALSV